MTHNIADIYANITVAWNFKI